jgi:hypothetical protein
MHLKSNWCVLLYNHKIYGGIKWEKFFIENGALKNFVDDRIKALQIGLKKI